MEFEDILHEVGSYGSFQKTFLMTFVIPVTTVLPMFWLNLVFIVSTPSHWCHVPSLANSNLSMSEKRLLTSPPGDASCSMHDFNYTELLNIENGTISGDLKTVQCENGWEYDKTDWETTITTKWNLVCSDSHYKSYILFWQILGTFLWNPVFGALSDRIGRKLAFFILTAVTFFTEFCSIFADNFTVFLILRCINGGVLPIMFVLPFILTSEIIAPEKRSHVNGIMSSCWTIGSALMPVVAYFSRTWVTLCIVNCVTAVVMAFYWSYLPESPSWLVSQGRYEEAQDIMMRIAVSNGKSPNAESMLKKLKELGERNKKQKEEDSNNPRTSILKYPRLRRNFFILTYCWAANSIAYLGLTYNAINLNGNEYVNFLFLALVEIPGVVTFWFLMDRFGRRWTNTIGFSVTSIICFLPILDFQYSDLASTMLGKFVIYGIMLVSDQQGSELYPTVIRSVGMGIGKSVAAGISILVPYLAYLSVYGKSIPFVIIGCTCIVATVLTSFLPETLNENLPQTITDAEEFGKNRKFFSWIRKNRTSHSTSESSQEMGQKRY